MATSLTASPTHRGENSLWSMDPKEPGASFLPAGWRKSDETKPSRGETPSSSGRSSPLGRTSGLIAAGAWAARTEISNLLEKGYSATALVSYIRRGEEGEHPLRIDGSNPEADMLDVASSHQPSETSPDHKRDFDLATDVGLSEEMTNDLFDGQNVEDIVQEQKAILAGISRRNERDDDPPWLKEKAWTKPRAAPSGLKMESKETFFSKRATPPSEDAVRLLTRKTGSLTPASDPRLDEVVPFKRKAEPPPKGAHIEKKGTPSTGVGPRRVGESSLIDREKANMEVYVKEALDIFEDMEVIGVEMEILKYIRKDGEKLDRDSFRFHTAPNRASTGLRYVRVMKGLLNWSESFDPLPKESMVAPMDRLRVVEYIELLVQRGAGANTPQTLLFALDFFGKAFGFPVAGAAWNRSKRLAVRYAKARPGLASRAPIFQKETLMALEAIVMDPYLGRPSRVSAGKLRLCVQASIRYDDLLHTPIGSLEWVRRRGSSTIVGVRAKSTQGKNKARPWVASILGVTKEGDGWLQDLLRLVLASHGSDFGRDDHFGKETTRDGDHFTLRPARMESDVTAVKRALNGYKAGGGHTGMTEEETNLLRWHGSKATLTTLMQHLQLDPRAIRFAGDWSSREDTMPDVYLREAQLMVLKGQETCLAYLRQGGDFGGLVSGGRVGDVPHGGDGEKPPGPQEPESHDSEAMERQRQMIASAKEAAGSLEGVGPDGVTRDFLDPAFGSDGALIPSVVEEELKSPPALDPAILQSILVSETDDEEVYVSFSFDDKSKAPAVKEEGSDDPGGTVAEVQAESVGEAPLADEDGDLEGMTGSFVLLDKPTNTSKLHLPTMRRHAEGLDPMSEPRCGARGKFCLILAGEAMDPATEPCSRCFGKVAEGACKKLCSMRFYVGGETYKCTRRCVTNCTDSGVHLCHVRGY